MPKTGASEDTGGPSLHRSYGLLWQGLCLNIKLESSKMVVLCDKIGKG